MHIGEIVLAPVNRGQFAEAQVIEIHGDIVRVSGSGELAIVREQGREPLGVGFPIQALREIKKAMRP